MDSCSHLRLLTNNDPIESGELADIAAELKQMETALQELQSRIQQHRTILKVAPHRQVPLEVWGRIFNMATFSDSWDSKTYGYTDPDAVTTFCLVCRAWRDGAYLENGPWGHLSLPLFDMTPNAFSRLQVWLTRASRDSSVLAISEPKSMMEDIYCECGDDEPQDAGADGASSSHCIIANCDALQELLSSEIPLRSLELPCAGFICFRRLMASVEKRTPPGRPSTWMNLKSLVLEFGFHGSDQWADPPEPSKSTFSYLPPNLTSLVLRYSDLMYSPPSSIPSPITLSQLSSLTIQTPFLSYPHRFLVNCPSLERLTLSFFGARAGLGRSPFDPGHLSSLPKITLPLLQRIALEDLVQSVDGADDIDLEEIVCYLRLPHLRHLAFRTSISPQFFQSIPLLLASMEVPASQLSSLKICDPIYSYQYATVDAVVSGLAKFTSLTHLSFDGLHFEGDFFEELRLRSSALGQAVLPSLEVLELENMRSDDTFRPESVLLFFEARHRDGVGRVAVSSEGTGKDSDPVPNRLRKVRVVQKGWEGVRRRWEESFGIIETLRTSYGIFVERVLR